MNLFKFFQQPLEKVGPQKETDWFSLGVDSAQCFVDIIKRTERPSVLDLGYTSGKNIEFFTKLGCKIFASDLIKILIDTVREQAEHLKQKIAEAEKRAVKNPKEEKEPPSIFSIILKSLDYPTQKFDGILCWDIFDFCDGALASDLIVELKKMLQPGGALLCLFHGATKLERKWTGNFCFSEDGRLKYKEMPLEDDIDVRFYENRMIEDLFSDFSIERFVHLRDSSRIVLVKMKPRVPAQSVGRSMEENRIRLT